MLVSRMHGTPVVSAPSLLVKRAHAGSPYTADGGPAPKRASQGGLRNWMSPVGKRKSGSAGASDMGFHDARKAYKMQRAAATMRADERIFSSTPATFAKPFQVRLHHLVQTSFQTIWYVPTSLFRYSSTFL